MEGEVKALSREALHAARGWAGGWGLGGGANPRGGSESDKS